MVAQGATRRKKVLKIQKICSGAKEAPLQFVAAITILRKA
jgi:hypothetical protein